MLFGLAFLSGAISNTALAANYQKCYDDDKCGTYVYSENPFKKYCNDVQLAYTSQYAAAVSSTYSYLTVLIAS